MFKKTFHKLQENTINFSQIKQNGDNLFALMYSNYKRHTVYKPAIEIDYKKNITRKSAFDYVNDFVTNVMPKMEKYIESRLMEKFLTKLSPEEREMAQDAYNLRRYKADLKKSIPVEGNVEKKEEEFNFDMELFKQAFCSLDGTGFANLSNEDIGKFIYFPEDIRQEYFPFDSYGDYFKEEYPKTNMFSTMCREDGLKFANLFALITTHEERVKKIDYKAILNRQFDFKQELNKFEVFSLFYQEIAYTLLKVIESFHSYEFRYVFTNIAVFDCIVTILLRNLRKNTFNTFLCIPEQRFKIIHKIVKAIHEKLGNNFLYKSEEIKRRQLLITEKEYYPIQNVREIIEEFKIFQFELEHKIIFEFGKKIGIEVDPKIYGDKEKTYFTLYLTGFYDYCKANWRPKDMRDLLPQFRGFNNGVLLTGESGNGKSQILTHLHAWGKENNWVVFTIPRASKYTQDGYPIERHRTGLYVQVELGMHFLIDFKIINYNLIKDIQVDLNEYGKCDFAGARDDEPEPVPVLWDERREVYTDSWSVHNKIPEEQIQVTDHPDHVKRVSALLSKPKTILEIVNFGIENPRLSISALAEVLNQLYKSETHKSMIIVDEYNEWYRPTIYDSYKYANYKDFNTKIPPMDLAMVRLFMKFDGHLMKQGIKIFSTSLKKYHKAVFNPEDIMFPKGYSYNVENLKLDDLRNAVYYYLGSGYTVEAIDEFEIQGIYDNTQGNWNEIKRHLKCSMMMPPKLEHYEERKARNKAILSAKKI
jgi:hypothetical protein